MTGLLVSAAATALAIACAWWIHTRIAGWIPEDDPSRSARKRHRQPTPLLGFVPGLACVVLAALAERPYLACAIAVAVATGFLDDRTKEDAEGLSARSKGALLLFGVAILCLPRLLATADLPAAGVGDWFSAVLWIGLAFVLVNATNFLDNTHGVTAALTAFALAWTGEPLAIACAGPWLGFLPFNWPGGRMFLGDSGALAAGTVLAGLTLPVSSPLPDEDLVLTFAPTAMFWIDFAQVVTARLALGYAPWISDRRHVTHILQNAGLPRSWVAPVMVASAAVCAWLIERC